MTILFCLLCATTAVAQQQSRERVYVGPDQYNQKVIRRYNRCHFRDELVQPLVRYGTKAKDFTAIFGLKTNSLMSNDDIEINFQNGQSSEVASKTFTKSDDDTGEND